MLDLVLKAQGKTPKLFPKAVYLTDRQATIARFLQDHPGAPAKAIGDHMGLDSSCVSVSMTVMFRNDVVTRELTKDKGVSYNYTLAVDSFEVNSNIKKLNDSEIAIVECIKKLCKATAVEIGELVSLRYSALYYFISSLRKKGIISTASKGKAKHVFELTKKGIISLQNGGIYERA